MVIANAVAEHRAGQLPQVRALEQSDFSSLAAPACRWFGGCLVLIWPWGHRDIDHHDEVSACRKRSQILNTLDILPATSEDCKENGLPCSVLSKVTLRMQRFSLCLGQSPQIGRAVSNRVRSSRCLVLQATILAHLGSVLTPGPCICSAVQEKQQVRIMTVSVSKVQKLRDECYKL